MCGRFAQVVKHEQLKKFTDELRIQSGSEQLELNYNLAPSQRVTAVVAKGDLRYFGVFQWGLVPSWMKAPPEKPFINVRSETVMEKPSFKASFLRRRCLIPAAGFYEWRQADKQPFFIYPADGGIMLLAGIYDTWEGADGSYLTTLGIMTTAADASMQDIHHRMPLLPAPEQWDAWLAVDNIDPRDLKDLLQPSTAPDLQMHPVSKKVGSPSFNTPACMQSIAPDTGSGSGQQAG